MQPSAYSVSIHAPTVFESVSKSAGVLSHTTWFSRVLQPQPRRGAIFAYDGSRCEARIACKPWKSERAVWASQIRIRDERVAR